MELGTSWAWLPSRSPVWRGREMEGKSPQIVLSAKQHGTLPLRVPSDQVSLSPPRPSVRVGTGKEDGQRVSGRPGRVLGCSLLLLPPGQPGLSSQTQVRPAGLPPCVTGINK